MITRHIRTTLMSPRQAMQTAQALHTLTGFSFPYNVNLASAAPFVDPSGFQLLYSCSPISTATNTVAGTIQLSDSHLGGSVSLLNHGDCTTTTNMIHCAKNVTSERITHNMCHSSDRHDSPQRTILSLNSNSSDSSSVGSRTPEVVTPASSPLSVTSVSGTLRLTGPSSDSFCHLPYPSSPAECASLAVVSSSPYGKTTLGGGVPTMSDASPTMQASIPRREVCRLPKPFTIEAILGLESSRCVDAALNMIANVERTFDYKRRNNNTNINNTTTISNNNHVNKSVVHCSRNSNHIVNAEVGNIHRRINTATSGKCLMIFFVRQEIRWSFENINHEDIFISLSMITLLIV